MIYPDLVLRLPKWVEKLLPDPERTYPSVEERMRLAIELSRQSVIHGTGGPFGAAIFERQSGRLFAPGVNLVLSTNCSVLHAEIVAIMLAQQKVGHYDLGSKKAPELELISSTEPCAMCLGAIPWSGLHHLVCGARDEDARGLGFDEGAKPGNWQEELKKRGITVVRDVCRPEAREILQHYVERGGHIYNGRQED